MSHPRSRQKRHSLPPVCPGIVAWLVGVYCRGKQNSGFILPTATLLVIIAFLVTMSLLARTANRVVQVSGQRDRVAIEGPVGEAIDRAKAKLEYMLTRDDQLPTNPGEEVLESFLAFRAGQPIDFYTFPDENRCGAQDGSCFTTSAPQTPPGVAPTWMFRTDLNGNGTVNDPDDGVTVYTIIGRIFRNNASGVPIYLADGQTPNPRFTYLATRAQRAANFVVNNAPALGGRTDAACNVGTGTISEELGRFPDPSNSSVEVKNFQIYAVTYPNRWVTAAQTNPNAAFQAETTTSVIFQQDRTFATSSKWGAWFRNDLEVFPGPTFNWNGAMHTEGSLIFTGGGDGFTSYLISSAASCFYPNSGNSILEAVGVFTPGSIRDNNNQPGAGVRIHTQPNSGANPVNSPPPGGNVVQVTQTANNSAINPLTPINIALDPLEVVVNNASIPRVPNPAMPTFDPWLNYRNPAWSSSPLVTQQRVAVGPNQTACPPYVDDAYRADNRLGPKPSYARPTGADCDIVRWAGQAGDPIPLTEDNLVRNVPPSPQRPDDYGLDGYWERRAAGQGTKVIVGQRLELGNVGVWGGWRTYGRDTSWSDARWQSWTGDPSNPGAEIWRSDNGTNFLNTYRNDATQEYTTEVFGTLFRSNALVQGTSIPAPGATDPLYPARVDIYLGRTGIPLIPLAYNLPSATPNVTQIWADRPNEQLQRRTQRDNLAAVQATAIYHHRAQALGDPVLPVVCLSSTIHPGTEASYFNSITYGDPVSPADPTDRGRFTRYPSLNANIVRPLGTQRMFPPADFFTGRGTANMEYGDGANPSAPPFTEDDFTANGAMLKVLTNLAQFAGDPDGAYPPAQAPSPADQQIYPDPVLTMWGNFSNLRRTLQTLADGTEYAELSPADQSTLHTAGCAMGMLATNVHWYLDWGYFGNGNDFWRSRGGTEPFNPNPNQPPLNTDTGASPNIQIDLQRLGSALRQLQDGILNEAGQNYELGQGILASFPLNTTGPAHNWYNIPAEYYIAALARIRDQFATPGPLFEANWNTSPTSNYQQWNRLVYLARLVNTRLQIVRDRTYGFREYVPGAQVTTGSNRTVITNAPAFQRHLAYTFRTNAINAADPYKGPGDTGGATTVNLPCDLSLGDIHYFGYKTNPSDPNSIPNLPNPNFLPDRILEREMVALARLCPTQPKYPSLFYLMPGDLNSEDGVDSRDTHSHDQFANSNDPTPYNQPSGSPTQTAETFSEPYVMSRYISDVNAAATYEFVNFDDLNALRLGAREPLPVTTGVTLSATPRVALVNNVPVTNRSIYNRETDLIVSISQPANAQTNLSSYRLGFAEKAMWNGRQAMTARVMDLDLDLLRRNTNNAPGYYWLSEGDPANNISGGIIYAFREDAVREDALLRPALSSWDDYYSNWKLPASALTGPGLAFRMDADPADGRWVDPPVAPSGLSTKAVDYYPDPDRRSYGFRLMNGARVDRVGVPPVSNIYGLTFISDNPAYIQAQNVGGTGYFNRHMNQEFTQLLPLAIYNFDQFYTNRTTRDPNFGVATLPGGSPSTDTWRPVEVFADAITILSANFCDGYVENAIRNTNNVTGNNVVTNKLDSDCMENDVATGIPSFRNWNERTGGFPGLPNNPATLLRDPWARENPYDMGAPIMVGSTGQHFYVRNGTFNPFTWPITQYERFDAAKDRGNAQTSEVNAVIISGLVPSRVGQSYGGLHNFPRFLEGWPTLRIQGSMMQLNFSNYATGPFDQDSWEPTGPDPVFPTEWITYYGAPTRVWGYDPALQRAPSAPVAQRMNQATNSRSEYFLEVTADDPYTCQLRRFVFSNLTCP